MFLWLYTLHLLEKGGTYLNLSSSLLLQYSYLRFFYHIHNHISMYIVYNYLYLYQGKGVKTKHITNDHNKPYIISRKYKLLT